MTLARDGAGDGFGNGFGGGFGGGDGSGGGFGDGNGFRGGFGDGFGEGFGVGGGFGCGEDDGEGFGGVCDIAITAPAAIPYDCTWTPKYHGVLRIGCEVRALDDWIKNAEEIDEQHGGGIAAHTRALAVKLKQRMESET